MAEKRVIELEIQDNSKTLKAQYKEAVLEVQKLAAAYGETSQQVAEAAKKAAGLKDQIEDTNDAIAAFKGEGKFAAAGKAISSVASGFSAVEGGMALLGVESENLQKTMLKVQAAMALAQGLEGLEDAGRAFKQLGTVAVNALKGVRGAIAATGIGLLVVALGTIVAYWDDIKAAVSGVSSEQEKLNVEAEKKVSLAKDELAHLERQENILKLQGKSEREILNYKIKKIGNIIAESREQIKQDAITADLQEKAAKRNYDIAKKIIKATLQIALIPVTAMVAQIDLLIKGANKVSQLLGGGKLIDLEPLKEADKYFDKMAEGATKFLYDPEEVKANNEKLKKERDIALEELLDKEAQYKIQLKEINQKGIDDAKNAKKEELDALIELEIKKELTDKKRLTELLNERLKLENLKGAELELAQANNAEKIRQAINDDNNKLLDQETVKLEKLKILGDSRYQTLQGQLNAEVEAEKEAARQKQLILETQAIKAQKLEEQSQSFKIKSVQQGLELVSSITELFGKKGEKQAKKAFEIQKAANIASALISTYQSATAAYASQFVPIPDPTSPIRGGVAAGMAVAAGLVNVAKIASQKFEGGSMGGGSSTPSGDVGGGAMAPNFNVIGSSGVNQLAQIQQQPTRAYVVSGDVANGLSLERNRLQNASF